MAAKTQAPPPPISREATIKYFVYHLKCLPDAYITLDTTRLTVCYFCLSGLDLLDALDAIPQGKQAIVDWIYSLQVVAAEDGGQDNHGGCDKHEWRDCGFIGGGFAGGERIGGDANSHTEEDCNCRALLANGNEVHAHIAMTYTALASLVILGDDLSRVRRKSIIKSIAALQLEDGRFVAHRNDGESDCRFIYCAYAVAFMLGGVGSLNLASTQKYIRGCAGFDGGISLLQGLESHGGSTYCATASLSLLAESIGENLNLENRIGLSEKRLAKWCLHRQVASWEELEGSVGAGGFQGRPNKDSDTCYTFWILGALQMIDRENHAPRKQGEESLATSSWLAMVDREAIRGYLLAENGTHDRRRGGFGKVQGATPDILHSYYGVCGLALIGNAADGLRPLDASLSISQRARAHLATLHAQWAHADEKHKGHGNHT